mmetsp:Transcript_20780/g.43253  ORF Transcript_20780/g.43253 Transcript_20780/m.43253 type:complete len:119 (+) Transcript_20780:172-528(+)
MSDSEQYAMENVDAGASETIPMEAGQIKKGGLNSAPPHEILGHYVKCYLRFSVTSVLFDGKCVQGIISDSIHALFFFTLLAFRTIHRHHCQLHHDQGKALQGAQYLRFQDRKARTCQM